MKKGFYIAFLVIICSLCSFKTTFAQLNKQYYFNLARNQISNDQFTDAIKTLNELIRADQKLADAWYLRGLAKYSLSDMHGSLADFNQAIANNPVFSQAFLYRGIVQGRLSKYDHAQNDFDMVIDLRPNWVDGYFSRGVNYLITQQYQKSINDFTQVIKLQPRYIDAWINRGTAYLYNGDTLRALTDYGQATKLNPFYAEGYSKRGRLLAEMKNYHLAIDDLNKAIELDRSSSINFFLRGLAYNSLDSLTLAISDLSKAIDLSPNNALSLYNRALLLWKTGKHSKALSDFDRVVEINPENLLVFYNRGVLQLDRKRYNEAIRDFSTAIDLFPDFANAFLARSEAFAMVGKHFESTVDRNTAQRIAEKHYLKSNQPYADTTQKFDNLIAFSSDFTTTATPKIERIDAKPVDILPFIRIIAVPIENLKLSSQSIEHIDTINMYLKQWNIALTEGTDIQSSAFVQINAMPPFYRHFFNGLNLSKQKKYNQAIQAYDSSLFHNPKNPIVLINVAAEKADMIAFIASFEKEIGVVDLTQSAKQSNKFTSTKIAQLESFTESLKIFDELKTIIPNNPIVYYNLGNIYALSNQISRAIANYTHAIELNPYCAEAWYNRGLIRFMQKDANAGCVDMGKAGEQGIRQAYQLINRFCKK